MKIAVSTGQIWQGAYCMVLASSHHMRAQCKCGRGAYFGERATASWSLIMCQVSGTACMHMTLL